MDDMIKDVMQNLKSLFISENRKLVLVFGIFLTSFFLVGHAPMDGLFVKLIMAFIGIPVCIIESVILLYLFLRKKKCKDAGKLRKSFVRSLAVVLFLSFVFNFLMGYSIAVEDRWLSWADDNTPNGRSVRNTLYFVFAICLYTVAVPIMIFRSGKKNCLI
jgi:hypothetical protein